MRLEIGNAKYSMSDEVSRLRNQPHRRPALLIFNGLGFKLTNGTLRQRFLKVFVEESDDKITSLACG